ncbi:MAG: mucoidy inhibitor MuiA family protein, partial [Verrucomicrobia bacterium]|nr:mucoidy inhibitor MuiA family protein [Verrucomicrobiota bacterium]
MKITRLLLLGMAIFGFLPFLQSQSPTDSTISEVSVYMGSARVTRLADVDLDTGENVLQFMGLPTRLDVNQIQLGLAEGVPIRLDNLKFQQIKDREDTAEEKRLKDEVEELRDRIQVLNAEKKDQQGRIRFAESLSTSFTKSFGDYQTESSALERAAEVLEFYQKTTIEAQSKSREIDESIAELNEELEELLEDLAEESQKANQLLGEVTVRIFAAEAGTAKLVFNYLVPNASWFPSYAVRVDSSKNSMEVVYQANIWQETGESWDDVAVTVSTSLPSRSGNVPELGPVFLQPNQYFPRQKRMRSTRGVADEVIELSAFAVTEAEDADYQVISVVQAGFSTFSATLPTQVTLASEREPSRFPIFTKRFQAQFWSEVVPLIQEKGFLKSKTTNAFDLPLMPGQAQVFIDGTLTSRVSVPYALPGDELELSLGVDDFIIVNRKETLRETEYSGFIDKTTVLKRAYTIEVTNFHPMSHKVKVFERFPISRNEKIVVKRKAPDKSKVEIEEDTGVFFWEETLTAKQLKEYTVEFEVVHPREW